MEQPRDAAIPLTFGRQSLNAGEAASIALHAAEREFACRNGAFSVSFATYGGVTMNAIQKPDAIQIARSAVREHFRDVPIAGVSVRPDLNFEGDPVLRVVIVIEGDSIEPFKPFGIASGMQHVSDRLFDAGIEEFPLVSFMTRQDATERNLDPA